jgi:lysophospholipase L1-like esterase
MTSLKLVLLGLTLLVAAPSMRAEEGRWVATWGTAPQLTEPGNLPPEPLAGKMLRQFVRVSLGGKTIRLRLANTFSKEPVTVKAARVALASGKGSAGTGEIDPATDRALAFDGKPEVVIPAGSEILSDPLDFALPALGDVSISLAFSEVSATTLSGHPGSRTTSFIAPPEKISATSLPEAARTQHWYLIGGIEVQAADKQQQAIVVLGDSITDGRGSTTDGNDRWPDALAKRLHANPATPGTAVLNMGIGGNAIFGGLGPAAVKRFDRDVLGQTGARHFILFEGVNDIGGAGDPQAAELPDKLIAAYTEFATKAREKGMRTYAATITPFGTHSYFTPAREECRQRVNAWIRDNEVFDSFIDFDAVVRDPANPAHVLPAYSNDGLHLNPAGYHAMADSIDLKRFAP